MFITFLIPNFLSRDWVWFDIWEFFKKAKELKSSLLHF